MMDIKITNKFNDTYNELRNRFIDPLSDWGFKKLFGTDENKEILIEFLKSIFPHKKIVDLEYIDKEQLGLSEDEKIAIFDVACLTESGETFIVEMQRRKQKNFIDRVLYYSAFPMLRQERGTGSEYSLAPVYMVAILDFKLFMEDDVIIHRFENYDRENHIRLTDKLEYVFIELPKFHKDVTELESILDKWFYVFINLKRLYDRPKELQERIFKAFFNAASFNKLSSNERLNYTRFIMNKYDEINAQKYAEEEKYKQGKEEGKKEGIEEGIKQGKEEGKKEGIEEGIEEGRREIIEAMISKGIDEKLIVDVCNISLEELEAIKQGMNL